MKTNELINLYFEQQNLKQKLNWMIENGYRFYTVCKSSNPFNEYLNYSRISHRFLELEKMINKRKKSLFNYYKYNYQNNTNQIWL